MDTTDCLLQPQEFATAQNSTEQHMKNVRFKGRC